MSHQIASYMSWILDTLSKDRDAFQISWAHLNGYAFPPFSLIGRVLSKVQLEQAILILVTLKLLQMSVRTLLLLPKDTELFLGPNKWTHQLVEKESLQLLARMISRKKLSAVEISEESAPRITNKARTSTNTH